MKDSSKEDEQGVQRGCVNVQGDVLAHERCAQDSMLCPAHSHEQGPGYHFQGCSLRAPYSHIEFPQPQS